MKAARQVSTTSEAVIPSASVLPFLVFATIDPLLTCSPAQIDWVATGASLPFSLTITNDGVPQDEPAPSTSSASSPTGVFTGTDSLVPRAVPSGATNLTFPVTEVIANISGATGYRWPQVNVPQGWYQMIAAFPSVSYPSSPFYVVNSTDTSCLIAAPPPSTSASSSSSSTPAPTGGNVPSETPPISSGSTKISRGAIAGTVIGGLALIVAFIGAFLFFLRYNRSSASSRRGGKSSRTGGGSRSGRGPWGGLTSVDSTNIKANPTPMHRPSKTYLGVTDPRSKHHSQSESIGPILASHTQLPGINKSNPELPGGQHGGYPSEEDFNSLAFSPYEEKFLGTSPDKDGSIFDTIAPLPMNAGMNAFPPTRRSSGSSQRRSASDHTGRRGSIDRPHNYSHPYGAEAFQMTRSPSSPTPAYTSHQFPHAAYVPSSSSSPTLACPALGNGTSTGSVSNTRRTARKPVPSYDPSDISLSPYIQSSSASPTHLMASNISSVNPSPYLCGPDVPHSVTASMISSSGVHGYDAPAANPSPFGDEDQVSLHSLRAGDTDGNVVDMGPMGRVRGPGFPELNHKSSFGDGRPLHYLIPDMPPPARD